MRGAMIDAINKFLASALIIAISTTIFVAISLTSVHGSVTIRFGHQPTDERLSTLAAAIPVLALAAR